MSFSLLRPEEMAYLVQAVRMCITVAWVVLTNRRQGVPARSARCAGIPASTDDVYSNVTCMKVSHHLETTDLEVSNTYLVLATAVESKCTSPRVQPHPLVLPVLLVRTFFPLASCVQAGRGLCRSIDMLVTKRSERLVSRRHMGSSAATRTWTPALDQWQPSRGSRAAPSSLIGASTAQYARPNRKTRTPCHKREEDHHLR